MYVPTIYRDDFTLWKERCLGLSLSKVSPAVHKERKCDSERTQKENGRQHGSTAHRFLDKRVMIMLVEIEACIQRASFF